MVPAVYYDPSRWRLDPDAVTALSAVASAGLVNVILSNHAPELPALVQRLGLSGVVEKTLTNAFLGVEKPSALAFRSAMRLVSASSGSWMIGDNPVADIAGARAVGLRAILVRRPDGDAEPRSLREAAAVVLQAARSSGGRV